MNLDFARCFVNECTEDYFHGIPLPQFQSDYPVQPERICTVLVHQLPLPEANKIHAHSYYELHFLLAGDMGYQAEKEKIRLSVGTWVLIPRHYPHKVIYYRPGTLLCSFQFGILGNNSFYSHLFKDVFRREKFLSGSMTERQTEVVQKILSRSKETPLTLLSLHTDVLHCIIDLAQDFSQKMLTDIDAASRDVHYLMALEYINDNICRPINVEQVSHNVYLSPRHLNRLFHEKTGKSISSYILQKKIDKAREMLQLDDAPLAEIAVKLGFRDEYYFNRFFKQRSGVTPHRYRAEYNKTKNKKQETDKAE